MSSEGSSRVRQFGLYKTIDSQTAEFLKLSRKRQIRRGCACAAVSTAITVTVVVGALLVYEFGFSTDFKTTPDTLREPSWFNEVNDSKATFDNQKNSPKNIKNNGKLLAVILKALDQKRYLESIIEEHSSQTPLREITPVYPFQKDVFTDAKNRKLPVGYKPPKFSQNRRKDSSGKARKIMDYQRVMTYLNTLTFTKNTEESTHATTSSWEPSSYRIYRNDIYQHNLQPTGTEVQQAKNSSVEPEIDRNQNSNCICPGRSNLTNILEKLFAAIQQLRPKVIENKTIQKECNKKYKTTTVKSKPLKLYTSDKRTTISMRNNKHTTIKTNPILKIEMYPHTSVPAKRNNDTDEDKTKHNETTPKPFFSRTIGYKNYSSSYKAESPWKLDLGNTDYDDAAAVYVQADHSDSNPSNNRTKVNSLESDFTYDYDEKINHSPTASIQYAPALDRKNKTSSEYNYLANYIDGLTKLPNLIVKKPPTPLPSKEETKVNELDLKQVFSHEIVNTLKLVTTTTEIARNVKTVQGFNKIDDIYLSSTNTPKTVDENIYKSNTLTKVENNQAKSRLEPVADKVTEKFSQNRRKDSSGKARKAMDYQRVMMYLNTMTFTKNTEESTHATTSSWKPSNKKYKTTTVKSKPLKLYTSDKRTTISMRYNKHTTIKTNPNLKIEMYAHTSVPAKRNNDTDEDKTKYNETTPKPFFSRTIGYKNYSSSYKAESPWKLDLGNTDYDDAAAVYVQADHSDANPSNNRAKVNSSESDFTYDYDDKINHSPTASIQYAPALDKKNKTSSEYNYFANYIDGLSKLKNLIVNKPPTPLPSKEETKVHELDLKQLFSHEIVNTLKLVTTTTEIARNVKPVEGLKKIDEINMSSTNTPKTVDENIYKSNTLTKVEKKQAKSRLEAVADKVTEKLALTPMMKSFLLSKKENGLILNLDETTTIPISVSNSISTDSEDLPFSLKFFEDDEHSSNLKTLLTPPVEKVQEPKKDIENPVNNNREPFRENASKIEPFGLRFFEEDEHEQINSSSEAHTTTSTTLVQQQEKSKGETVVDNREPSRKKARKKEKNLPKVQSWDPMYKRNPTQAPNSRHKRPKIKEIFYMTGDETPIDDFENNLNSMYVDASPVNYTALANSFLNKVDSDSIEKSKSMIPETRPSHLEIRRSHDIVDFYTTDWGEWGK